MDKKNTLVSKTLVIGVVILFTGMSLVTSNCSAINKIKNDLVENNSFKSNRIKMSNPPVAEILYPEDGSTIYTRYTNFSIKFTDDTGLTDVHVEYGGESYTIGYGRGFYPPSKIFYFNESLIRMRPGYVWIVAKAFDEDGNIGMDTAIFYYDDSNDTDLYPPEIEIWKPYKGQIYIFGESLSRYFDRLNCSIVIGKFEIFAIIEDYEEHLQKVEIYIDEEVVYEQEFSNVYHRLINWNCNKFLIGMHEIKIVAIDSYNHSSMEKLNCFIINFL
jgi:hypothetical protein